jgi:hypothetical protein
MLMTTTELIAHIRDMAEDVEGTVDAVLLEAADRMEEMQTREKKLSQKLCCFTGESLEDAADRLREEHNKAKMEADRWKEQATQRRGLVKELREAMGIKENMIGDAELKAALDYIRKISGISVAKPRTSRPTLDQMYP